MLISSPLRNSLISQSLSLSLSLSHTHTRTLTHTHNTHTHSHALSLSLSLSHTHTHTHALSLSLSHTHTHTHTHTSHRITFRRSHRGVHECTRKWCTEGMYTCPLVFNIHSMLHTNRPNITAMVDWMLKSNFHAFSLLLYHAVLGLGFPFTAAGQSLQPHSGIADRHASLPEAVQQV